MNTALTYPLTDFQLQVWAGQQLEPASPLYNMALAVTINSSLDADKLNTIWVKLQNEYPSLRSRVEKQGDNLVQIADNSPRPLEVHDFSVATDPDSKANALLDITTKTLFKANGVLTNCLLIKLSDERWIWYIKQHHVVTDAQSFASIWQKLNDQYHDLDSNAPQSLPYANYVEQQSSTALSEDLQEYWESHCPGQPLSVVNLGKSQTTLSLRQKLDLTAPRLDALNNLIVLPSVRSFSKHLSKNVLFLTLFAAYLHRLSNDTTITIGVPVPNRDNPQFSNTPGLFVEVLPMQLEVRGTDTFNELAKRVRGALLNHLKHAKSGACQYGNGSMISSVVNYINASIVPWGERTSSEARWIHPDHADQQHALRLQITDWTNSAIPTIELDSNCGIFSEQRQQSLEGHWWQLFDAMMVNADNTIGSVSLIQADEQAWLKHASSTQSWPASANTNPVLDRILSSISANPDLIALQEDQSSISYQKLDELSTRIANNLRSMGIGAGHRVALQMKRSNALVLSILGVLKSGAAYVPIDSNTPDARLATLISDATPSVLLTDYNGTKVGNAVSSFQYEDLIATQGFEKLGLEGITIGNTNTAYILYTSGSTGTPKGVVISTEALGNYINWASAFYANNSPVSMPFFTPIGFDLTVTSLLVPLVTGGTIHVYPEQHTQADTRVIDVFKQNLVDIIKLTPAHLALIQHLDLTNNKADQLIVGGEALQTSLADRITSSFNGNIKIHNEYGPTESTVGCVVHTYDPNDNESSVPIGKPTSGVQIHVLNADLQVQPVGTVGELYLSGASLADGYWNNDQLTAAAFSNPEHLDNTRLYKTGDVVHHNERGQLIYHGRTDTQVKIQGVRIELDEIQNTCLDIESVTDCLVMHSAPPAANSEETFCRRCGLSSRFPDASVDASNLCSLCSQFDDYSDRTAAYFRSMSDLHSLLDKVEQSPGGDYDCIVLLSGGKDSTYALSRMVDTGLRILAFTLDNGYISDQAKANIDRVCKTLKVDHRYGQSPHMNEIFVDSLKRYSNVCNGCFKVLYTLSLQLADELGINTIVTGLSRGQFFETRLTEELFDKKEFNIQKIDSSILSARKAYHLTEDAVSQCMDVKHVQSSEIFDRIQILDFYRYCDVSLEQMYDYLSTRVPWIRPDDTGRSTNCLINDAGIYVHKTEKGFHNYSMPYSWDVRLGHKNRDEALEELNDDIDIPYVEKILSDIGYELSPLTESDKNEIVLYYTSSASLSPTDVRAALRKTLPHWMQPQYIVPLPAFPLSNNGKIDRTALPAPVHSRSALATEYQEPVNETQNWMVSIWSQLLKVDSIGINDNFFDLNGDSLTAIRITAQINQKGYLCTVADLFNHPTVALLCDAIEKAGQDQNTTNQTTSNESKAFDSLNSAQLDQLQALLARRPEK